MLSYTASCLLIWTFVGRNHVNGQANTKTPIFLDNMEYLGNGSNVISLSYPALQEAFKNPSSANESSVNGFDWTKPFPGSKIDGHKAYLRIARDIPVPEEIVHNSTTTVASLSFSVPQAMMGKDGVPKAMDPSWYICRHIYVSSKIDPTVGATSDDSCSFIPPRCTADVRGNLTKGWMTTDDSTPCSGLGFDAIPESCWDSFGFVRAEVSAYDSEVLADKSSFKAMAVDEQSQFNWRIGTGFHDKGDKGAYEIASNRTYLVVDVWGYSKKLSQGSRRVPEATLTCLSAKSNSKGNDTTTGTGSATKTNRSTTSKSADPTGTKPTTIKSSGQASSATRRASLPFAKGYKIFSPAKESSGKASGNAS